MFLLNIFGIHRYTLDTVQNLIFDAERISVGRQKNFALSSKIQQTRQRKSALDQNNQTNIDG